MKCNILHETPGRMRVHLALRRMSLREADLLEYDLKGVAGVVSVKVFDRTQDAVITYTCPRADIVQALSSFSFTSERALARLPEHTSRALNREYEDKLVFTVCRRAFSRLFLPVPVQTPSRCSARSNTSAQDSVPCCTANSLSPCSTRRP